LNLPLAKTIGDDAFSSAVLNTLDLPVVETIGDDAFVQIENLSTTEVTLPSKFNTEEAKNRIFGPNSEEPYGG
jgi:hypothetical protein